MAAPVPPDPKTLKNWEEAFEYHSIPQVRTLHKQIQHDLGVNRERLRALVGESYRDLLRTAEKIIEMDGSMQKVESNLAETSRNCNYRLMEKKARNVLLFQERVGARDREKYMFTAQIAVLQGCSTELSNLLHRGGSSLLAARIFVVSRLVLKSLQEKGTTTIPIVTSLRDQMTNLRELLLRHIDHTLRMTSLPTSTLVESMCALALVKTSSPADLLRHFLSMRSNAISAALDSNNLNTKAIHSALKLFHSTLQYTEAIFPKKISEALQQLKSKPLFENLELRNIPALNLDTNDRWLPEDIRGFIPWVRHDELERSRVHDSIKTWANRELEALNGNLRHVLRDIDDIGSVVSLRREILDSWNSNKSKLLHVVIGSEEPKRRLRGQINDRMVQLLEKSAGGLVRVGDKVEKLTREPKKTNTDATNLWSDALLSMPLTNGAAHFRKTLKAAVAGHDSSVKVVIHEYRVWSNSVIQNFQLVKGIGKVEKRDEFEDDDEFGLGSDDAQDGAEDSENLKNALCQSVEKSFKALEAQLDTLVLGCEERKDDLEITTRATFLLRSIRHVRQNPPHSPTNNEIIQLGWFAKPLVTRLQSLVSKTFSMEAISLFGRAIHRRQWGKKCPSVPLWEGSSRPLPTQPSPDVFKFLHELVRVMGRAGSDIWTPATVQQLRKVVRDEVWVIVEKGLDGRELRDHAEKAEDNSVVAAENGTTQTEQAEASVPDDSQSQEKVSETSTLEQTKSTPTPDEQEATPKPKDTTSSSAAAAVALPDAPAITTSQATQLLYDLTYLNHALLQESNSSTEDKFTKLKNRLNVFEEGDFERVDSSTRDYWKRTSLLFSLLA